MNETQFKDFVRYAVSRLDGAWFRMVEKKYGVAASAEGIDGGGGIGGIRKGG